MVDTLDSTSGLRIRGEKDRLHAVGREIYATCRMGEVQARIEDRLI
jgi:hypothetical protein